MHRRHILSSYYSFTLSLCVHLGHEEHLGQQANQALHLILNRDILSLSDFEPLTTIRSTMDDDQLEALILLQVHRSNMPTSEAVIDRLASTAA